MAIIAGNFDLAEIIKIHKASDVGESADILIDGYGSLCVSGCYREEQLERGQQKYHGDGKKKREGGKR